MTTHRNTWKRMEREIAKDVGTERNPLSGINGKHTASDTLHPNLYIECKYSNAFPKYILDFEEDIRKAEIEDKIPMRVYRRKGIRGEFVLLRWEDLLKFMSWGYTHPNGEI